MIEVDIYIMGVAQRIKNIKVLLDSVKGSKLHLDVNMLGSLPSMIDIFKKARDGAFLVILQDDIELVDGFSDWLEDILIKMNDRDIPILSLYAPRSKELILLFKKKKEGLYPMPINRYTGQANVYAPSIVAEIKGYDFSKHNLKPSGDDSGIICFMKAKGIKPYVCLPSMVQHKVYEMMSVLGHPNSADRSSALFFKDFNFSDT